MNHKIIRGTRYVYDYSHVQYIETKRGLKLHVLAWTNKSEMLVRMDSKNIVSRRKNDFTVISKNLDTDLKIILLDHQNNYIGISSNLMSNAARNFDILAISLDVLHNYFDSLLKLFLGLYLPKFLDTSLQIFHANTEWFIFFLENS